MSTKGAMKAAEIIMGDKHKIRTDYGEKTVYGIVNLIDQETAAPELLEALKAVESWMDDLQSINPFTQNLLDNVRSAIAKAEGGA